MYYFIINPASQSDRGYKIWKKIEQRLVRDGVEYQAYLTEYAGQATEYARKLTSHCKEARVIVVVGGDGTMNEVVDGIVSCDMVTLGYIPVGTGSDLARGLRLSRRPMRGLRRIFKARRIRQIDYGVIAYGDDVLRHRRFIVSAGIGLDAEVCQHMQHSAIKNICNRIHLRRLSYRILGFIQYLKAKPIRGYILLDGTRRNLIIFILSVHRFNPARVADSGLRRRRTAATATWRSALSAMPRSGRCLEPCSGRCSGAPTTGGFGASAAGRSRSTRNARWQFTWTARAVSTRAIWKSAVLSVN